MIVIEDPGALTLIEDAGRFGYAHLGVPRAGAFDRRSWMLANRLVGNPAEAAALETLGGGLTVRFTRACTLAVTGARGPVALAGQPVDTNTVLHAKPGSLLRIGPARTGIRYYLAVGGAVIADEVLGSRSYDTLGRIGPRPLRAGDQVRIGHTHTHPVVGHAPVADPRQVFDVVAGPDADDESLRALCERTWDLDPQSNRIGVRLAGEPIVTTGLGVPSKPMVLGAVQLPPNGLPIILGPDHPTTGGYPVIAVVTQPSMDDVAQWSGGPRFFSAIT